jgi:hypothetical protein
MSNMTGKGITNAAVNLILIAILVPIALGYIFTANTDGWDATTVTLFKLIGTLAVIGMAIGSLYMTFGKGK